MEAKQIAKNIRKELKQKYGYTNKQVNVKTKSEQVINVLINDWNVKYKDVEMVAKRNEEYQTDEITGEILMGGNTFVFVKNVCTNPEFVEIGKQLFKSIDENRENKENMCVEFLEHNTKVHLLDIDKTFPKYIIETKNERTQSNFLYTADQFAKHLTKVEL